MRSSKEGQLISYLLARALLLVRAELTRFLDEIKKCKDFFHEHAWDALESVVNNGDPPIVVGLFAERCCNAAIAIGGGHTAILGSANKGRPTLTYFQTGTEKDVAKKDVSKFMESGKDEDCSIFLPQSPFYEAVDIIVVRLYREKKASDEKAAKNEEARKKTSKKAAKDEKKAIGGDISMDLAKTQVTLHSMEKHFMSTILAKVSQGNFAIDW